jgi:hypothetical protein
MPHSVTIVTGSLGIIFQVTMVTKVAWGFPIQSLPRTEKHVGLHVKRPLFLSDFNQNRNVSTNFSETSRYQIS